MRQTLHLGTIFKRLSRVVDNPVTRKELRGLARGRRPFLFFSVYLGGALALVAFIYASFLASRAGRVGASGVELGRSIFSGVLVVQALLVLLVTPTFTTAAIAGERAGQSLDLLRTTLLTAHGLLLGKLGAAMALICLLVLGVMPLQAVSFLFGGITPLQLMLTQLILLASALVYALIGLYFSARFRTTLAATTATLLTSLGSVIALPLAQSILEGPLRRAGGVRVDWHALLVTTNLAGILNHVMDPVTPPGLWLPTLGYLLLAIGAANVCYVLAWRSLSW